MSREKDFLKKYNALSLNDLSGQAPAQAPLTQGVMKFTNLVDPSFIIITIHLVCMDHVMSREEDFLRNT